MLFASLLEHSSEKIHLLPLPFLQVDVNNALTNLSIFLMLFALSQPQYLLIPYHVYPPLLSPPFFNLF
jgi:hypothetical protein